MLDRRSRRPRRADGSEVPRVPDAGLVRPGHARVLYQSAVGLASRRLAPLRRCPRGVARHINEIVQCRRAITADTALRMERALGMTAESWLDLQRLYDLDHARAVLDVSDIEPLVATG